MQACWGDPAPDDTANGSSVPRKSAGQVRKFCRENFLSYRRMREWRDILDEIRSILDELGDFAENPAPASYETIHRSILSGLSKPGRPAEGQKHLHAAKNGRR